MPGPTSVAGTTTEVDVTYTTLCPVTETVTGSGTTYTKTYTTTSAVLTKVRTTLYETVSGPAVTESEGVTNYQTITSLCPVTDTKTVGGSTVHVTWTSTRLITTYKPTTVDVTVGSGATVTEYPTVVVTQNGTVVQTHSAPPSTATAPTATVATSATSATSAGSASAPPVASAAGSEKRAPLAAALAGIVGAAVFV